MILILISLLEQLKVNPVIAILLTGDLFIITLNVSMLLDQVDGLTTDMSI